MKGDGVITIMPHVLTAHERCLEERRNRFYETVRDLSNVIPDIRWRAAAGNHMDFSVGDYRGYVNWYFLERKIDDYNGNVCVVFWDMDYSSTNFGPNPRDMGRVIASTHEDDVALAAGWAIERIREVIDNH